MITNLVSQIPGTLLHMVRYQGESLFYSRFMYVSYLLAFSRSLACQRQLCLSIKARLPSSTTKVTDCNFWVLALTEPGEPSSGLRKF